MRGGFRHQIVFASGRGVTVSVGATFHFNRLKLLGPNILLAKGARAKGSNTDQLVEANTSAQSTAQFKSEMLTTNHHISNMVPTDAYVLVYTLSFSEFILRILRVDKMTANLGLSGLPPEHSLAYAMLHQ